MKPAAALLAVALWAFLAVALRLLLHAPALEGFDSIGFAAGLHHFDLAARTPHFPGYAVFILVAKAASWLGANDVLALVVPGVLGAALLVVGNAWTAWRLHSPLAGVVAAGLSTLLPGLHLIGARPLSEGLGAGLLAVAVALWLERSNAETQTGQGLALILGVTLGLILGVRVAWLPVVLALMWGRRPWMVRVVVGCSVICAAWLVAMVQLTGVEESIQAARTMLGGHFGSWGGSLASEDLDGARAWRTVWGVWAHALGGFWGPLETDGATVPRALWSVMLVAGVAGCGVQLPSVRLLLLPVLAAVVNLVVLANPNNPRHASQLAVLLVPLLAVGLASLRHRVWALALLWCGMVAIPVAMEQAHVPNPAEQVADFMARFSPSQTRFYGWTTTRTVGARVPNGEAVLVGTMEELARHVATNPPQGRRVFFESRIQGKTRRSFAFEPVASFARSPLVDPAGAALTVFLYRGRAGDVDIDNQNQ